MLAVFRLRRRPPEDCCGDDRRRLGALSSRNHRAGDRLQAFGYIPTQWPSRCDRARPRPSVAQPDRCLLENPMAANRMSCLDVFIGTWNTTGDVLKTESAPADTLSGTDTYRWIPGRHFIVHDADARFGVNPARSMEVIGYDVESRKHWARSYDDQGTSELFEVALEGKRWSITGASARFKGKFNADHSELTGLWELKDSKGGWQPWIELKLVRA